MIRQSLVKDSTQSVRRWIVPIIVVSVLVRLGAALYQGSDMDALPGVTDQLSYHELALRVIDGHGFSFATGWWPATRANQPTAHWSFLYVLFLVGVYSIFGPAPIFARLIQSVLVGILHPLLAWRIGRRLFGPSVGVVAAALTAIYFYFVFYSGALVTESFYFLAVLWSLDLATAIGYGELDVRSMRPWFLLGIACGVGALLRQVFLLMVPFILVWTAWVSRGRESVDRSALGWGPLTSRIGVTLAVLGLCILPWTIRNYRAFGEIVLLNTNAGFAFFWGNHPVHGTEFIPILPNDPDVNYQTLIPREFRRLNEARLDRALLMRGFGFIASDPVRYARLSLSRTKEFFKFWPTADSSAVSNLARVGSFALFLPCMLYGMVQTYVRRRDEQSRSAAGGILLVLVAVMYSLVHVLTWTLIRYRLPVDALMMPFAGVALVALFERVANRAPAFRTSVHLSAH